MSEKVSGAKQSTQRVGVRKPQKRGKSVGGAALWILVEGSVDAHYCDRSCKRGYTKCGLRITNAALRDNRQPLCKTCKTRSRPHLTKQQKKKRRQQSIPSGYGKPLAIRSVVSGGAPGLKR